MRIVLIGYGKMGMEIEKVSLERKHKIIYRINSTNTDLLNQISKKDVDVAMEFSSPESAFNNVKLCLEKKIPVVCGSTGWLDKKPQIEKLCKKKDGTFFYTANYSIGMNILFKLNEFLAKLISNYPEYEIKITEKHHSMKKDIPSGSALTLAHGIIANHPVKQKWQVHQPDTPVNDNVINIYSIREGDITGEHFVTYQSHTEKIEISHVAQNRWCFAMGAILAAEFCQINKGILNMDDLLFSENE